MKSFTLPIVIKQQTPMGFFVSCPPLQGCYSQGETYERSCRTTSRMPSSCTLKTGWPAAKRFPQVSVSLSTVEIAV